MARVCEQSQVKCLCVLTHELKVAVKKKNTSDKQTKAKQNKKKEPCEGVSDILNKTDHGVNLKIKAGFEVDGF